MWQNVPLSYVYVSYTATSNGTAVKRLKSKWRMLTLAIPFMTSFAIQTGPQVLVTFIHYFFSLLLLYSPLLHWFIFFFSAKCWPAFKMATFHRLRKIFTKYLSWICVQRSAINFQNMQQLITIDIVRIFQIGSEMPMKRENEFFSSLPIHQLNRIVCSAAVI